MVHMHVQAGLAGNRLSDDDLSNGRIGLIDIFIYICIFAQYENVVMMS